MSQDISAALRQVQVKRLTEFQLGLDLLDKICKTIYMREFCGIHLSLINSKMKDLKSCQL